MVIESTARRPGVNFRDSKTTHPSDGQRSFVFYDPYYESLLQRKRERDSLLSRHHVISLPTQQEPPSVKNIESLPQCFPREPINSSGYGNEQDSIPMQDQFNLSMVHTSSEIPDAIKVALLQKAMRSLYVELDRQKAQITEVMARESRAIHELKSLRRKVKVDNNMNTVPLEEYHELEAKYTNAVKLIDDLNWRLSKLPDDLT